MNELITDAEIAAASEAGEGPKLESWSRMVTLVRALKQQQAEDRKEIERLREVMIQMSEFAIGKRDVCGICGAKGYFAGIAWFHDKPVRHQFVPFEPKSAPSQPQPAESDGFEERIANLENGLKIAKEHRDNAIRRAEVQEMRARRAEAIVETYNKTGFADSDRMAEEYLKAMERAEDAEAKLSSLLAQKPEATVSDDEETRRAIAEDRAFLHGMEAGWNLGVDENREEFNRRLEAGYKAIREANRELKAKDAEKGQGK